jgi:hypothetical protein
LFDDANRDFENFASDINERLIKQTFDNNPTRVEVLNSKADRRKIFLEIGGGWNIDEKVVGQIGLENDCEYSIVIFYHYSGQKKTIDGTNRYTNFSYNLWILRNRDSKTVYELTAKNNSFEKALDYWNNMGVLSELDEKEKYESFLAVNTYSAMSDIQLTKQFEIQMKQLDNKK